MKIHVLSRKAMAALLEQKEIPANAAIISISTPDVSYVPLPFCKCENLALLELQFDDVDSYSGGLEPMSWEQAESVADFVLGNRTREFWVHCDAGQSRSAGVAAAIAKYLFGDDSPFFQGGYTPNMKCYSQTLCALHMSNSV